MKERKGIILAGGAGTRLHPVTISVSKQLLPVYDKPMVYYPLTVLMMAGIREIMVITTPHDVKQFQRTLGDGSQWGISLEYKVQPSPDGLAQAFVLAEGFLSGSPAALILGDNIFFGQELYRALQDANEITSGAAAFGYNVHDPKRYGVVGFDKKGAVKSIVEKPIIPASNYAVTGLYFVDETAPDRAKNIQPSARGEIEITCLLKSYLNDGLLSLHKMGGGFVWMDAGTHDGLLDAGNFVRTLTKRQGIEIGSPSDVAFHMGWIDEAKSTSAKKYGFDKSLTAFNSLKLGQGVNTIDIFSKSESKAEKVLGSLISNNLMENYLCKPEENTG